MIAFYSNRPVNHAAPCPCIGGILASQQIAKSIQRNIHTVTKCNKRTWGPAYGVTAAATPCLLVLAAGCAK